MCVRRFAECPLSRIGGRARGGRDRAREFNCRFVVLVGYRANCGHWLCRSDSERNYTALILTTMTGNRNGPGFLQSERPTVYLDQRVWIRLASVLLGRPREKTDTALINHHITQAERA